MTMWIQHGWGRSDKIEELAGGGLAGGVVVSPWNATPANISSFVDEVMALGLAALIDPQGYVHTIDNPKANVVRRHDDLSISPTSFTWDMPRDDLAEYVKAIVELNERTTAEAVIAPGAIQTFGDQWVTLPLEAARIAGGLTERPVLASLIVEEHALGDWPRAEEWLDAATRLDIEGFYVVVVRTGGGSYPTSFAPEVLSGLLRLLHRLSENDYRLVLGYSDIEGLAATAAGAQCFASGWSYSLRAFAETQWQARMGRQPRNRIFIPEMLSPLLVDEARQLLGSDQAGLVPPEYIDAVRTNSVDQRMAHMSYLRGVGGQAADLEGREQTEQLETVEQRIAEALGNLRRARARNPALESGYQSRLASIQSAVASFRSAEDV